MSNLGLYKYGNSFAHRLDPRVKVTAATFLIVSGFLSSGWFALGALALFALLMVASSDQGILGAFKSIKPFLPLMVFIGIFDAVFVSSGDIWWSFGPLSLSSGGLLLAADCLLRFACVLIGTSVLMKVTSPTELSDATGLMLAPLQKMGLDVRSLSLALGMTLRFIPVFFEELSRIREAQEARHARFDEGGVVNKVKSLTPLVVPLFVSAFRRSRALACAVTNRGFGVSGAKRTSYRSYELGLRDAAAMLVSMVFMACCLSFTWLL